MVTFGIFSYFCTIINTHAGRGSSNKVETSDDGAKE